MSILKVKVIYGGLFSCLPRLPNLILIIIMTKLPQSITYIFPFVFKGRGANKGPS